MKRHGFRITLSAAAGQSEEQAVRSLRAALKCLLRSYGLRCVSAEPFTHGSQPAAEDDPQPTIEGEHDE